MSPTVDDLLARHDAVIVDLDGVVFTGSNPIPGAITTIRRLTAERPVFVATNSVRRTPAKIHHVLRTHGLEIPRSRIVTCSRVTRSYLSQRPNIRRCLGLGIGSAAPFFEEANVVIETHSTHKPDAILLGAIDPDEFTYQRYEEIVSYARSGVPVIATSEDLIVPGAGTAFTFGTGFISGFLKHAIESSNYALTGKPSSIYFDYLLGIVSADEVKKPLFVGDTLHSDMLGANNAGLKTLLVLSGSTTGSEALATPAPWSVASAFDANESLLRA